jgi:hypothetical protein
LLSVLALSLGLLAALFSIHGIYLLENLYHRRVQNLSEADASTDFAPIWVSGSLGCPGFFPISPVYRKLRGADNVRLSLLGECPE